MSDWRRDLVTKNQRSILKYLKLPIPPTKGEASDLISSAPPEKVEKYRENGKRKRKLEEEREFSKKKALLGFLGIAWGESEDQADAALDNWSDGIAHENEMERWDLEKYDLYPDLYKETKKEGRERKDQLKMLQWEDDEEKKKSGDLEGRNSLWGCMLIVLGVAFVIQSSFMGLKKSAAFDAVIIILSFVVYSTRKKNISVRRGILIILAVFAAVIFLAAIISKK